MHEQQLLRRGVLERVALQLQQVACTLHIRAPWGIQAWQTMERLRGVRFRLLLARRRTQAVHVGTPEWRVFRAGSADEGAVPTERCSRELSGPSAGKQVCCGCLYCYLVFVC